VSAHGVGPIISSAMVAGALPDRRKFSGVEACRIRARKCWARASMLIAPCTLVLVVCTESR
jgi:hypothetical protein